MRVLITILILASSVLILCTNSFAVAQEEKVCTVNWPQVTESAVQNCTSLQRNQFCYGSGTAEVTSQEGFDLSISRPGDVIDAVGVETIRLGETSDEADNEVSAVAMRVQGGFPEAFPDRNVDMLIWGNVEFRHEVEAKRRLPSIEVTLTSNANVRGSPSVNGGVRGSLRRSMVVNADGISEDGLWYRVTVPEENIQGWVLGELVSVTSDSSSLLVLNPDGTPPPPLYGPMQAFRFAETMNDPDCSETARSGLLIQTPPGYQQVNFLINDAQIQMSATAFLQARADGEMTISVIDGFAQVTSQEVFQRIPAGTTVSIPVDANLSVSGPPSRPVPYDIDLLGTLPLNLLQEQVTIVSPPTSDEITVAIAPLSTRIVTDFYALYECKSRVWASMGGTAPPITWNYIEYSYTCAPPSNQFGYFYSADEYRLESIEPEGTVILSATASGQSLADIHLRPEDLLMDNGYFSIWMPLDNRVFTFSPFRVMPSNIMITPVLAPAGTEVITIMNQSVLAQVYSGEYLIDSGDRVERWRSVQFYDSLSGLLLRIEDTSTILSCSCDFAVIPQTPFTSSRGIWELKDTNQPLAVVSL